MIAWAMTDLPEPDSPTSAVTFPGRTRKLAPLTASKSQACSAKAMPEILNAENVTHRRHCGPNLNLADIATKCLPPTCRGA